MKKIISGISIAILVFCSASVSAQQGNGGGRMMDPVAMKQRLIDSLQFTSVQADSVVGITQEFRPKMRDIFMDQNLSQDDKRAKMMDLNAVKDARIKAVLGADLFKKYDDFEKRNRPQRMRGGGGGNN